MERLTTPWFNFDTNFVASHLQSWSIAQALGRLQAIEDILGDEYDLATLSTLVKARDEGRAVELDMPCKPMVWGDDDQETCLCPDCGKDLMGLYDGECMVLQCPDCGQYIDGTKVITIAEAEAAIDPCEHCFSGTYRGCDGCGYSQETEAEAALGGGGGGV